MRGYKTILTLALAALLPVVTIHCKLELIPGLQFFACADESESASHESKDCESDGCELVENGFYKIEDSQVDAAACLAIVKVFVLPALDTPPRPALVQFFLPAAIPELPVTWQFSYRTAAPPRAPSFVS